ncbi:MCE family protein [Nocardia cyriacigeorgica]|uniref:MCE family protein n=1 Tax=Nocardia cyriacigeorgica TaxID=135487 RepID=UPI001487603B|nr:MCE family protein [Nocardia cyriacigeorgica]
MMNRISRRARRSLVAVAAVGAMSVTSGCGLTVEKLPLPKPGATGDTYSLKAVFDNALNLPDQAKVKVGGSDVGVVTDIKTSNFQAIVDMDISTDIQLPVGSTAELRQATPLGDVFVALSMPPAEPGTQMMQDGDTLPLDQTSAGATVEELLLSVSMMFNGGGIAQLARLGAELDSIVGGRSDQVVHLVNELTGVVTSMNDNSARIDSVLAEFGALATTLEARRSDLGQVADTLPNMIGAVAENNKAIGDLLAKIGTASVALGDYANTSGGELAGLLDSLDQLMGALAATGDNFGAVLDALREIRPGVNATFRGNSLAAQVNVTNLDIALLTAPGTSKFFDVNDLNDFAGSLIQVLQVVYGRVTGGHR